MCDETDGTHNYYLLDERCVVVQLRASYPRDMFAKTLDVTNRNGDKRRIIPVTGGLLQVNVSVLSTYNLLTHWSSLICNGVPQIHDTQLGPSCVSAPLALMYIYSRWNVDWRPDRCAGSMPKRMFKIVYSSPYASHGTATSHV